MNKSNYKNAKITDKTSLLCLLNVTSNGNLIQLLAISKVNNNSYNNAIKTDKTSFFRVLDVIPRDNLSQLLVVSKVNNNNAKNTYETAFFASKKRKS